MPFTKGHPKIAGRTKGALNRETLTKLERRAYFEKRAQEKFDEWIDECRPEYGLDQFIGKATDKLDVATKGEAVKLSPAIRELADKLVELEKGYWHGKRLPDDWQEAATS